MHLLLLSLACTPERPATERSDDDIFLGFEDNLAPFPEGEGYPERLEQVSGEADDYDWAHSRGYLHGSLADSWEALQQPEVLINRRRVAEYTVTADIDPDYPVSYRIHNVVHDVLTVEFDNEWRQDWLDERHTGVGAAYEMTEGTPFISLMEGVVLLYEVAPQVTSVEMVEHIAAAQGGPEPILIYQQDLFNDLLATVHGEELPDLSEE